MRFADRIGLALALLAICRPLALAAGEPSTGQPDKTEWMALFIDGKKAGHAFSERSESEAQVTTRVTMNIALGRAGMTVKMKAVEEYLETRDGKPLACKGEVSALMMSQKVSGEIRDGQLHITQEAAGNQQQQVIPWPAEARMAEGQRLESLKRGLQEGTTYTLKTFSASDLTFRDLKVTIGPLKEVDLLGRIVRLTEVQGELTLLGAPLTSTTYVNEKQEALKSIVPMMGMQMVMVACSKEYAQSPDEPGDFFNVAVLAAPRALQPKELAAGLKYRFKPKPGARNIQIPATDEQAVRKEDDGSLTVEVRKAAPPQDLPLAYAGQDPEILKRLRPTAYLQSEAKELRALAEKAAGDARDAATAAQRIEAFVSSYIDKKSLAVGYASALEVAQCRQGDCSEHAVLGAALCRAKGLPARVVSGLAYVPQFAGQRHIFGPHAWYQVYLKDRWISYDGALHGFDCGHIALAYGDGEPADFLGLVHTLGNLVLSELSSLEK